MCVITNPMPIRPVIAITYFLPTAVEYRSTMNGFFFAGALTAVPVTGPRLNVSAIEA